MYGLQIKDNKEKEDEILKMNKKYDNISIKDLINFST